MPLLPLRCVVRHCARFGISHTQTQQAAGHRHCARRRACQCDRGALPVYPLQSADRARRSIAHGCLFLCARTLGNLEIQLARFFLFPTLSLSANSNLERALVLMHIAQPLALGICRRVGNLSPKAHLCNADTNSPAKTMAATLHIAHSAHCFRLQVATSQLIEYHFYAIQAAPCFRAHFANPYSAHIALVAVAPAKLKLMHVQQP